MLRVSSRLLRSARSCGSPLLHDAAAASGARIAAEVSPVEQPNANHALLWRRTSQRSLSSAAKAPAAVVCACLLERLPIVMPPQPAWETEYQARSQLPACLQQRRQAPVALSSLLMQRVALPGVAL